MTLLFVQSNLRVMYFYFRLSVLFILTIFFSSCQPDEVQTFSHEPEKAITDEILPEEYFKANINGKELLITNGNGKSPNERAVGAEIFEWQDLNKNKFHALRVWARRKGNSKELQTLGGYIQKYYGNGVYFTGTSQNQNYCHYLNFGVSWYSNIYRGEEFKGKIEIKVDTGDFLEGTMNYTAFNANDPSKMMEIMVEFRVFHEE